MRQLLSTLVGPPSCTAFEAILPAQPGTIRQEARADWPDDEVCAVDEQPERAIHQSGQYFPSLVVLAAQR